MTKGAKMIKNIKSKVTGLKDNFIVLGYSFVVLMLIIMIFFNKDPLGTNFLVSLKLWLAVMVPGYLIAYSLFDHDEIALVFIGLSFGFVLSSLIYYFLSILFNINQVTFIVPVVIYLIAAVTLLHKFNKQKSKT